MLFLSQIHTIQIDALSRKIPNEKDGITEEKLFCGALPAGEKGEFPFLPSV